MAAQGPAIKSFGTFSIQEFNGQCRLTISKALDPEPFPTEGGAEVQVEEVIPEDEPAFLRLTPVSGNGNK
jgi:hypothetical protein